MLDFMFDVRDYVYLALQWGQQHPNAVAMMAFGVLVLLTAFELHLLRKTVLRAQRGTKMSREDYETESRANLLLSDGIVDVIDNAYVKGLITNKRRNSLLKGLGQTMALDDLLISGFYRLPQRVLKRLIRRRLNSGFWLKPVPDLAKDPPVSPRSQIKHQLHGLKLFR